MQFNINECIVSGPNEEVIVTKLCEGKMYKMNFSKVHEVDATNFIQSLKYDDTLELQHS